MTPFQPNFQQESQLFVIGMEILVDSVLEERMALFYGNDSDSDFSLGSRKDRYDSDSDSSYEESGASSQHSADSISTCDTSDDDDDSLPSTKAEPKHPQFPAALSSLLKDFSLDDDDNNNDDASLAHEDDPAAEEAEMVTLQTSMRSSKSDSNLLLSMSGRRQGTSLRRKGSKTKLMDQKDTRSNNGLTLKNIAFQAMTQRRRHTTLVVGTS